MRDAQEGCPGRGGRAAQKEADGDVVSMLVVSGAKVVVMHVRRKIGTRKGSQNADFPLGDGEKNMVNRRPALFNRFSIDICLGRREGVAERVSPSECTGITMCV